MKIVGNANRPRLTLAEVHAAMRNLKTLFPNCQLLQNAANCIAVVPDAADNFSMFIPWRHHGATDARIRKLQTGETAFMTSHKYALAIRVQALNALLEDPRADDDNWCVDLLYTLEAIYEIALHPNVPVVAASRANLSIAA